MVKILHTADVHLDSPLRSLALRDQALRDQVEVATRSALIRIVDVAIAEGVAAVLIAGDLFDGAQRSARTGAFLTAQFDRLGAAGVRVFCIKGNHDAENPVTGQVDWPSNVHVFDARGGKVALTDEIWIHGVSFAGRHAEESLLPHFRAPEPGATNIAMLHTSLSGAVGHGEYAPCTVGDLSALGFDYWALGHVHRRQVHSDAPLVVMPGMPQGRDIGEAGPKSATMLTIEGGDIAIEEVPTSEVEFRHSQLDISTAESDEALRAMLRAHLRDEAGALASPAGVLRLSLTGRPPRAWQILRDGDVWQQQAGDLARDTGVLWIEKMTLDVSTGQDGPGDPGLATTAVAELAGDMAQIREEPGFRAWANAQMEEVLADLPAARRADLLPDETAAADLLSRLSQEGAARVLARMRGAGN